MSRFGQFCRDVVTWSAELRYHGESTGSRRRSCATANLHHGPAFPAQGARRQKWAEEEKAHAGDCILHRVGGF